MNNRATLDSKGCPRLLLAGVMEHLACYLQTARTQSAHQALILLRGVTGAEDVDPLLAEHCQHLHEVLGDRLAVTQNVITCVTGGRMDERLREVA